jgi:hypothetical protein
MTDYTRYHVDLDATAIAIWCMDCTDAASAWADKQIWIDNGEQVTALCLANLIALADEHEIEHHAEKPKPKRAAKTKPKRQYRFSGDAMTAPHDEPKF